jgi:hypothetical protein
MLIQQQGLNLNVHPFALHLFRERGGDWFNAFAELGYTKP